MQHRPPGRPRKTRIRAQSEGKGLGGRRKKCSRCGRLGHRGTHCKESIDPAFGEDEHWGAHNAGTDAPESAQATAQTKAPEEGTEAPNSPPIATSSPSAPGSPPPATSPKAVDTDLARYAIYCTACTLLHVHASII